MYNTVPTSRAYGVAISGDYYFVADYGGGLLIIDITEPGSAAAIHVAVSGNYAFLAVDTAPGLEIYNIQDPDNIVDMNSSLNQGPSYGVTILKNYCILCDINNVFRIRTVTNSAGCRSIAVDGKYAYVAFTMIVTFGIFSYILPEE